MHSVIDVANYFLSLVNEDQGEGITNMKMQKLVYYAQGFSLAMLNEPLFEEPIEAWQYGPVVPTLYHAFKKYGNVPLPQPEQCTIGNFTQEEQELLNQVYFEYGQFSAWRLSEMTHQELPWSSTPLNAVISHEKLRKYFLTQIEA